MPGTNQNLQIGQPLEGGFFAGYINSNGALFAIVAAPKSLEISGVWGERGVLIEGADSFHDGAANTAAMAAAGCKIATQAQSDGWHIPSRDELELLYRAFKPTAEENYKWRSGDNPSSSPAGYAYTETVPPQTAVADFKDGNAESFKDAWYWSSTQFSAISAWGQGFDGGGQYDGNKNNEGRVRPVRRIQIIQ